MKRFLRIILSYVASLMALLLCGFQHLTANISESVAVTAFFALGLIPAAIVSLIREMHLADKRQLRELSARIDELEAERDSKADSDE